MVVSQNEVHSAATDLVKASSLIHVVYFANTNYIQREIDSSTFYS